ncbi:putative proteinase inhibitor I3, Kunitz legume, kunitz inhibitor STI-like superfamily [Helianthus anomalus]
MKTIILFSLALMHLHRKYYVMPAALDGENGGLLSVKFNRKPCPAGVEQSRSDETGLPLTFTPVNPKKGVIRLSTDVNIKFLASTGCDDESTVWKVKYDKALKQYAVMVGGVEGNPGPETLENWFKIEKTKDGYKLVFCPSVCSYCKVNYVQGCWNS